MTDKLQLQLQDISFISSQKHSNILYWEGAVSKIGCVSNGVPGGADVQVVLDKDAVEASLDSIVGMPLNCMWEGNDYFTAHNERFVIGSVKNAWIDGDYLMCGGYVYRDNFPDVAMAMQTLKEQLGFSIECYMKQRGIQDDGYDHVTKLEFTGLTVCFQDCAAFNDTFFTKLAATIKNRRDDVEMTKEEMQELLASTMATMKEELKAEFTADKLEATKVAEEKAKAEKEKLEATKATESEAIAKLEATIAEQKAQLEKLQATIPAPTAVQTAAKKDGDAVDYMGELDKINKMTCSVDEKMKLRFSLALKAQQ